MISFYFTDTPELADTQILTDGLKDHAEAVGLGASFQNFGIFARDENGTIRGGVTGNSRYGLLYVSILWVHPEERGRGLGKELMDLAETEARKRGCHILALSTMSYQAPAFYKKLGYAEFGRIDNLGNDGTVTRLWLMKTLDERG